MTQLVAVPAVASVRPALAATAAGSAAATVATVAAVEASTAAVAVACASAAAAATAAFVAATLEAAAGAVIISAANVPALGVLRPTEGNTIVKPRMAVRSPFFQLALLVAIAYLVLKLLDGPPCWPVHNVLLDVDVLACEVR